MYNTILLIILAAVLISSLIHLIRYRAIPSSRRLSAGLGVAGILLAPVMASYLCSFLASLFSIGLFLLIIIVGVGLMLKAIFIYYDYANASEASVKIFSTILNLLLKHSVDRRDDGRRTWFFIDEVSLLPATVLADAMSLGRGHGSRFVLCLQSAQLMTRHYKEDEARALLSLFPNVLCLKVQDSLSRKVLSDRYGEALCSYSFTGPGQKLVQHSEHRPVVADYDFSTMLQKKGDALCSFPNLSSSPFFYHGYRKELE